MKYKQLLALCLISVALSACQSDCRDRGECECVTRYHCLEGEICWEGKCVPETFEEWIIPERKFGETCIGHHECIDGICLPLGPDNGGVCTRVCTELENCMEGWTCRAWTGAGLTMGVEHVCVQETSERLCMECAVDGHCNATGDLCVELEEGSVCARDCSLEACPTGYSCESIERGNATYAQCLPLEGTCECGPGKEGMGRACTHTNDFGVCAGWSYCKNENGQYAWSACDAQMPAAEVCNGLDDDCDTLIDHLDPGMMHDELGEDGALYPLCYLGGCLGRWRCGADEAGVYAWSCDAGDPERELCNGADDNCNGEIDEAFINADGLYVDVNHCGACGASCLDILPNLATDAEGNTWMDAAACEARDGASVCVPKKCAEGYYPYPHDNPVSCIKLESPACQVCGADSDCRVYTDRCTTLGGDFGTHCLQSCDENSPYSGCTGKIGEQSCCPSGYTCEIYQGEKLCVPRGESCSCDETKLDMVRNCVVSAGTDVCQGRQKCSKDADGIYAWSECSASDLTVEVCDGQDNNCNGEIDEDFRDALGRYNAEEHCGKCNEDCPSRWKAPELHAEGACLLSGDDYTCQFTGCKVEDVILGKRCTDDKDCSSGQKCDRQVYYCVAESGELGAVTCSTDDDCKSIDRAHTCQNGVCKVHVQYHDVNGIAADGCECGVATNGGADDPEIFSSWPAETASYVDRDCDGIDGAIKTSLFVSAQSDLSKGTIEHPFVTISEAIAAFDPNVHTGILVAAGTYHEQIILKSGVRIYGGYSADFKSRNIVLNPTQISSPPPTDDSKPGAVYVPSVSRRTILNGLTIQGYDVSDSAVSVGSRGRNSYAIFVANASKNLLITNNMIIGGRAGDGGRGKTGDSGYAGEDGQNGTNSRECSTTTCLGETTSGGKGGKNAYCAAANGRNGATARDGMSIQDFTGSSRDGIGGDNNTYNHSYVEHYAYCKYDCQSGGYANGGDGLSGNNGNFGAGGKGCIGTMGKLNNAGIWIGSPASAGSTGGAALGGGGGGAGGGVVNYNDYSCTEGNLVGDIGGSGGGGGAGGCGGSGGGAGGTGGGSFGIWIAQVSSEPQIYANQVRLGRGGNGGDGGAGGAGGKGGKGGIGGRSEAPAWCAGAGGSGGGGGDGGSGGGGGGGCGGVSVGIAGVGLSGNTIENKNTFEYPDGDAANAAGQPGSGGDSPAGEDAFGMPGKSGYTGFVYAF